MLSDNQLLRTARGLFASLHRFRAQTFVALVALGALAIPEQIHDEYRGLAEGLLLHGDVALPLTATVALLAACLVIWLSAWMVGLSNPRVPTDREPFGHAWPALCAVAPLLGLAWGLRRSAAQNAPLSLTADDLKDLEFSFASNPKILAEVQSIGTDVNQVSDVLLWTSIAVAILVAVPAVLIWLVSRRWELGSNTAQDTLSFRIGIALSAVAALFLLLFVCDPVTGPRVVGSIPVIASFLVTSVVILSLLSILSNKSRLPAIGLLIAYVVLLSSCVPSNYGQVRTFAHTPSTELPSDAEDAFRHWLEQRKDAAHYNSDNPYPVYIVSAAGGGIYAMRHAAVFLARLQDQCPSFAQHVFAISGVSGGSLGSALFASLVKSRQQYADPVPCKLIEGDASAGDTEKGVKAVMDNSDFLAPLVAATLFPDVLNKLSPWPIAADRAEVLESVFEEAWSSAKLENTTDNPLKQPFLEHWKASGVSPALFLNTTQINTGQRVVISPFPTDRDRIKRKFWSKLSWFYEHLTTSGIDWLRDPRKVNADINLSTAAVLSARFPLFTPAGRVSPLKSKTADEDPGDVGKAESEEQRIRLVDGGYFDNSGIETAIELYQVLKPWEEQGKVKVYLLSITGVRDRVPPEWTTTSDVANPVRAFLSARSARGEFSVYRLKDALCPELTCLRSIDEALSPATQLRTYPLEFAFLNQTIFGVPLGWHLSGGSRRMIDLHAVPAGLCTSTSFPDLDGWEGGQGRGEHISVPLRASSCVACRLDMRLRNLPGDTLECFNRTMP